MDDIRVYESRSHRPIIIEGIDTHLYVSGDLNAEKQDNKIVIKRAKNLNSVVLFKYDYTVFKDEDGNAIADNIDDTITALNVVFAGSGESILSELEDTLQIFTSRNSAKAALGNRRVYILEETILGSLVKSLAVT